jgi:hypothetical protein
MIKKDGTQFDIDKVVGGYRLDDLPLYLNLIDIIPMIELKNQTEMGILKLWETHFTKLNIPFAITADRSYRKKSEDVPYYSLWKERRV